MLKMKRFFNLKHIGLSLIIIVILCLICGNKTGLHIDEIYSLGLANHTYDGKIYPTIVDGEVYTGQQLWTEYTVVDAAHRFDYENVFVNQSNDVHPPLYYCLVHTICSLFPGYFNMWMVLGINIVLALIVFWQIYLLFIFIIKNEKLSIFFAMLFIFSMGAINSVSFFRMYILLMIWTNFMALLFCRPASEKKTWKFYVALGITVYGGILTQYYFAIYCFFACVVYAVNVVRQKDWRQFGLCTITIGCGAGIAMLTFPAMIYHIWGGYRGEEAFANLSNSNLWKGIKAYYKILNTEVFGSIFVELTILFALIFILNTKFTEGKRLKRLILNETYVQIFVPVIAYVVLVAQISPYKNDRYVMNIMGILYVGVFSLLLSLAMKYTQQAVYGIAVIGGICLIGSYCDGIPWMDTIEKKHVEMLCERQDVPILYIYQGDSGRIFPNYLELADRDNIVFIGKENLDFLDSVKYCRYDEVILYVTNNLDEKAILEKIMNNNPLLEHRTELFKCGFSTAYLLN